MHLKSTEFDLENLKISVAMATYNGANYVEQQIESILSQTLLPEEIIICDDASIDNTSQIIKKYEQNPIIKFYQNEKRIGLIENFKKAVSLTNKNNYVALSDQDDIWLPDKLALSAKSLKEIDSNIPAMVYSDLILVDNHLQIINYSLQNEMEQNKYQHCLETLLFGNFVLGCTIMFNQKMRSFFLEIPDSTIFNHDAWITLIAFTFGKATALPVPTVYYRKHEQNVTFSNHKKRNRILKIKQHLMNIFIKKDYLKERFVITASFYTQHGNKLSYHHNKIIQKFLKLENMPYLRQKWAFEIAFKNKWIKRFQ